MCVGNLISHSSGFSKSSLYISVPILLKPSLEDIEHYFVSMWNAGQDEAQAEIKITGRNIKNLRHVGDTIIVAESEDEKEPLDESEWGECKSCLKLKIQKTNIRASSPINSWQIDGKTMETVRDFIFLGSKIIADGDCSR